MSDLIVLLRVLWWAFWPVVLGIVTTFLSARGRQGGVDGMDFFSGMNTCIGSYCLRWAADQIGDIRSHRAYLSSRFGRAPLRSFAEARDGELTLLSGKVVLGREGELRGPLTGEPCAYARATVSERAGAPPLIEVRAGQALEIEDDSRTRVTVLLEGGRVEPKEARFSEESGRGIDAPSPAVREFIARHGTFEPRARIVCEERAFLAGETVLACGQARVKGDSYRGEGGLVLVHGPEPAALLVTNRTREKMLEQDRRKLMEAVVATLACIVVLSMAVGTFFGDHQPTRRRGPSAGHR